MISERSACLGCQSSSVSMRLTSATRLGGSPGAARRDLHGQLVADHALHRVEHLKHRIAAPVAAVQHGRGPARLDVAQGGDVSGGKIADVDIVALAGTVARRVVLAIDLDQRPKPERRLDRDPDQVDDVRPLLAGAPGGVGAGDVEIAQRHRREAGIGGGDVAQHLLAHQLGVAVGVDRPGRRVLADRRAIRDAVDGGTGRKDEAPDPCFQRGLGKGQRPERVVAIIFGRLRHRFRYGDAGCEMHDRSDVVIGEDALEPRRIVHASLVKRHGLRHRRADAGREIVEHDRAVSGIKKRQHDVAADIAGTAGHKHRTFCHFARLDLNRRGADLSDDR